MSNTPKEIFNDTSGNIEISLQPPRNEILKFEISGTPNSPIKIIIVDTNYVKFDFECSDWNGASIVVSNKSKLDGAIFISNQLDTITSNTTKFLKW